MIKFKREPSGLIEYKSQIQYKDTDAKSKNYFKLHDLPERFYLGKNTFRLTGNSDLFVKGSQIFIEIEDSAGNPIYYEIPDIVGPDKTRTVVVYIYPDTPPGDAKIYIGGRIHTVYGTGDKLPFSEIPTDPNYIQIPNMYWEGSVPVVLTRQNNTEVFFAEEPIIEYSEKLIRYDTATSGSRITQYTASASDQLFSRGQIVPRQFNEYQTYVGNMPQSSVKAPVMPDISDNMGQSEPSTLLPEFTGLTTIRSTNNIFSGSMVGGMLYVRNVDLSEFAPRNAVSASVFTINHTYSASIVNVINGYTVEVDRPFSYTVDYVDTDGVGRSVTINSFGRANNFTASYYATPRSITTGSSYESFISVEMSNLEPTAGSIDVVKVSYKPIGSFGESIDVGGYPIRSQNLFTDRNVLDFSDTGVIEKEIGYIKRQTDVNTYWTSSVNTSNVTSSLHYRDTKILGATLIAITGSLSNTNYVVFTNKPAYNFQVKSGTEYILEFFTFCEGVQDSWAEPTLEIYLSGSEVVSEIKPSKSYLTSLRDHTIGNYIGTVDYKDGAYNKSEISFIAKETAYISPKFVIRSGVWDIGRISIKPRSDIGYTPNHARLNIPLAQFKRQSELVLTFNYFNSDGVKSNVETNLYGVIFSGSSQISFGELSGIPSGLVSSSGQITQSLPPGTVSSSQQVVSYLPANTVSSSTQVITFLPANTVSSSAQVTMFLPANTVSSSAQVRTFLPADTVSSSIQVKTFLPADTVSSSAQVRTFLPADTVSSSIQVKTFLPADTVSSSLQVKAFLPAGTVSGSDQVSGGPERSVQFKYSSSISGSGGLFYDPALQLLVIGADAPTYSEQSFPSTFTIRSNSTGSKAYISFEKSGSTHQTAPAFVIMPERGTGSSANIGIGVTSPKSFVDMLLRGDHLISDKLLIANSPSGSGFAFSRTSSVADPLSTGKYYKILNSTVDSTTGGNKLVILGSTDTNGRAFLHIGLENTGSAGVGVPDTTWVSFGSGSVNSKEFSGSGYWLYDIDWNKIINRGPGIVSGSSQVDYDQLVNKPRVTNTGSGRFLYNNNNASQSIGAENLTYTTMSVANPIPFNADVFNVKNSARLVFYNTSSYAGSLHHMIHKEYVFEVTGTINAGSTTNIDVSLEFSSYEGNNFTGSTHNAGIAYTVESLVFATTGSNGVLDTYIWAGTVQGRATVSSLNNGSLIYYTPTIVSGGMDQLGSFGRSRNTGSNMDLYHKILLVSSSSPGRIRHQIQLPGPGISTWEAHVTAKIKQLIYEVDLGG